MAGMTMRRRIAATEKCAMRTRKDATEYATSGIGAGCLPQKTFDYRANRASNPQVKCRGKTWCTERTQVRMNHAEVGLVRFSLAPPWRAPGIDRASMSRRQQRVDAVGLRETREPGGEIDDFQCRAARTRGALPREQHRERGRIELRERRAIDAARTTGDARKTGRERFFRARVGQRRAGRESIGRVAGEAAGYTARDVGPLWRAVHDCLPAASCWLRCVRNWISSSTPCCWICSWNCCWYAW